MPTPRPAVVSSVAGGRVTVISRWIFNTFVVHDGGDGGALVVDPGLPSNAVDALDHVLALYGGDGVSAVACTHGHVDHVAGVPAMAEATGIGYLLPAMCERYLARQHAPGRPEPRDLAKIAPVMASQPLDLRPLVELRPFVSTAGHIANGMVMPLPPAGFLADGDRITGASEWEVLATPGHTDDSTCLYHRETATLLSGDSVLTHDGRAWFNPEHLSTSASQDTEERLRSLPVEHLLPGHGLALSGDDLLGRARSFRTMPGGDSGSARFARIAGRWMTG